MLLHPLEEAFDLPTEAVQESYGGGIQHEIVRDKSEDLIFLRTVILDESQPLRIALRGPAAGEPDDLVG